MGDSNDKTGEHLLLFLVSVALCAGGAYYWSYRVKRDKSVAIQQFKECVKEHLRDPRHYFNPELSLLAQGIQLVEGKVCEDKLPDKSKRKQVLRDPNFFDKNQWNDLRRTWKLPETTEAESRSPEHLGDLLKHLGASPTPSRQAGTVRFSDDLLSGKAFGPMVGPHCRASYDSDGYVVENIHVSDPCELQLLQAGQFSDDVKIDIRVKLRSGQDNRGYGLLFAQQPTDSQQLFTFTVDTFGSFQLSQHKTSWHSLIPWKPNSTIRQGYNVWNRLTVEIHGNLVNVFANEQRVGVALALDPLTGFVGCHLDAPGMVAVFRDITVTQLNDYVQPVASLAGKGR